AAFAKIGRARANSLAGLADRTWVRYGNVFAVVPAVHPLLARGAAGARRLSAGLAGAVAVPPGGNDVRGDLRHAARHPDAAGPRGAADRLTGAGLSDAQAARRGQAARAAAGSLEHGRRQFHAARPQILAQAFGLRIEADRRS